MSDQDQTIDAALFRKGPVVVFRWRAAEGWPVVQVTPNVQALMGHDPEDLISGRVRYAGLIHHDDRARVAEEVRTHVASGAERFQHADYRIIHRDGSQRWVMDYTIIERDAAGRVHHFLGYLMDVTERHAAEAARLASEARFRRMVDSLRGRSFLYAHDADGVFTFMSRSVTDVLGYSVAEACRDYRNLLTDNPLNREAVRRTQAALAGRIQAPYEVEVRTKDGGICLLEVQEMPLIGSDGRVEGVEGLAHDITQRRRLEQDLARSEAKYRQILDATTQGFWLIDPQTRQTREVNQALCTMLGYRREEMLGRTPMDFVDDENAAIFRSQTGQIGNTRQRIYEITLLRKDGSELPTQFNATTLLDENGQPEAAVALVTDLSRALERERQLARALEDLARFIDLASHDLQEPLRSITLYAALLERRHGDLMPEEGRDYLGFLTDGARRARQLIRDVRAYAQIDREALPPVVVDLAAVAREVAGEFRPRLETEGGRLTVSPDLPAVVGERRLLTTLVRHLIDNALKYRTPDRSPDIRLVLEVDGPNAVVTVADNGIGIEPDQLERVFGIFQRLHVDTRYSGTGVGLAVCRKIVERYGGTIWAESRPGVGTRVSFTLPWAGPVAASGGGDSTG